MFDLGQVNLSTLYSFNQYLLSSYSVPGAVLSAGIQQGTKWTKILFVECVGGDVSGVMVIMFWDLGAGDSSGV